MTLTESLWIFYIWPLFIIIENIIFMMIQWFSAVLNPQTTFLIYYGLVTVTIHFYHGLWLPIKYLLVSRAEYYQLWADREEKCPEKAVRRMTLEPRRDLPAMARETLGTTVPREQHLCVTIGLHSTSTAGITRVEI